MNPLVVGLGLVLALGALPSLASGGTLCVQLDDNGDVLVMRGIGKGSKAVSGYLAEYSGGSNFLPKPVSGSSLQDKDGDLAVGLTEFEVGIGSFTENIAFHRIQALPISTGRQSSGGSPATSNSHERGRGRPDSWRVIEVQARPRFLP